MSQSIVVCEGALEGIKCWWWWYLKQNSLVNCTAPIEKSLITWYCWVEIWYSLPQYAADVRCILYDNYAEKSLAKQMNVIIRLDLMKTYLIPGANCHSYSNCRSLGCLIVSGHYDLHMSHWGQLVFRFTYIYLSSVLKYQPDGNALINWH